MKDKSVTDKCVLQSVDSKIPEKKFSKIAIVGLGYVGLPLSIQFARSGVTVLGLDIDEEKIGSLNLGKSYIKHIASEDIMELLKCYKLEASTDYSRIKEVEAVLICVPTPLNINREPDISHVLDTGKKISPHLHKGMLVVLESTTYPGTTDTDLRKVLEEGSGMRAGEDFHLAYSPEREDPGNPDSKVATVPKVIGGYTENCLIKAEKLYSLAVDITVPVSSCKVAEAAKLTENIFRCVNIALVNELKVVFKVMDIDIWEVIEAAKTKPFGYMPFYPGPGLGGHCIPIDPFYLSWKAKQYGLSARFIELAGEVNTAMPKYVVDQVVAALNTKEMSVNDSRILIVGLAYKPNVDDDRESPSYRLMDLLKTQGAEVAYYDPHVPVIRPNREYANWADLKSIEWNEVSVREFDLAVILTAHDGVDYDQLAEWAPIVVDTRNAMANRECSGSTIVKA
ncbi:nucleotide sugar dehydrogenase [bacterium]|nr:nucleotide sugar dehydrogenase [bacterium]